jgi:hypothetical protein
MTRRAPLLASLLAVLCCAALLSPGHAWSQEEAAAEAAATGQQASSSPFGVGFQSSWPAWGLSGLYDVNENVTALAVVGLFGTLTTFGARGLYRFSQEESYNLYGYGTVGMWSYPGVIRENVVGFGGGAGIELNWRRIISPEDGSFPPLFSTIDLGLIMANFEHYNFSGFVIGSGLHWRF